MFRESLVALPTPFHEGRIDLDAFRDLVEEHVAKKTSGLVVCGTTGEASTLSDAERRGLITAAVRFAHGRIPVIAGVGTNCTETTIQAARFARRCGADGVLVVTPYYNRPSRAGLIAHFSAVAGACALPVVLYNVPSRTACDLTPDVVADIAARNSNVVAIKEVTSDRERIQSLVAIDGLDVLCGEDSAIEAFAELGAQGVIGVLANVAPNEVAELWRAAAAGSRERCGELSRRLAPLLEALYVESNPAPVKRALEVLGKMSSEVRLPLAALSPASDLLVLDAVKRFAAGSARTPVETS